MTRTLSLVVRNVVFTLVVPGLGAVWLPWRLLARNGGTPAPTAWEAVPVIAAGAALYVWCVWNFAAVGAGTPGPWDAPRRVVARGPYRWVRNPIYLAALEGGPRHGYAVIEGLRQSTGRCRPGLCWALCWFPASGCSRWRRWAGGTGSLSTPGSRGASGSRRWMRR